MSGKTTFGFVSVGTLKTFKIPLPPIEIQEQIVAELENYQKVIDGAQTVAENWKPSFDVDPNWSIKKLGEISEEPTPKRMGMGNLATGTVPKAAICCWDS